jgi:hypothetical protein
VQDREEDWRRVNTFSPGVGHSPHYVYHGAFAQIREIKIAWEVAKFSAEAKRRVAETILAAWQSEGSYFGVQDYVHSVCDLAFEAAESNSAVSVNDLPAPKEK